MKLPPDSNPSSRRPRLLKGANALARTATFTAIFTAALACLGAAAWAQPAPASSSAGVNTAADTVVITGNPFRRPVGAQPVSVLGGDTLLRERASTLGDTLSGLPGVTGSGFGPNSSRPVIRGLDGDRVRLLDNGGASIDASNLSFDHASAVDPLVLERVEVLRGPSALLYGGNATGGVVNAIDNRIPRAPVSGLTGRAELRLGGASDERAGAAVLEGGGAGGAWHVDAFARRTEDQRSPLYTPVAEGEALSPARRVRNSASRVDGGAVGASWFSARGFLGLSAETLNNQYGVTVEPDVIIRMRRDRLALAGAWRDLSGPVQSVALQASSTDYRHDEVEGNGDIGTTFSSRGQDLRVELRHAPWGALQGVWGVQAEAMRFSALGEEAFVPSTHTRSAALFVLEELALGGLSLSGGLRTENVQVKSEGDGPAAGPDGRFGAPRLRRFSPLSGQLGLRMSVAPHWEFSASLGASQRAPAYYELFANGVHVATAAYERGDPDLGVERSRHAEFGAAWRVGAHSTKLSVFQTRFARYIALEAADVPSVPAAPPPETPAFEQPLYEFRAVRAVLKGLEWEGRTRLAAGAFGVWDLNAALDMVRGDNLDSNEPLPRLPPLRARLGLAAQWGALQAGATLRHAAAQRRVPANDSATAASTQLDLWASGQWSRVHGDRAGGLTWFAKLGNVTNQLAYNAAAVATIRGLSPQPGRALAVGLRMRL